jgi:hypothetical protein
VRSDIRVCEQRDTDEHGHGTDEHGRLRAANWLVARRARTFICVAAARDASMADVAICFGNGPIGTAGARTRAATGRGRRRGRLHVATTVRCARALNFFLTADRLTSRSEMDISIRSSGSKRVNFRDTLFDRLYLFCEAYLQMGPIFPAWHPERISSKAPSHPARSAWRLIATRNGPRRSPRQLQRVSALPLLIGTRLQRQSQAAIARVRTCIEAVDSGDTDTAGHFTDKSTDCFAHAERVWHTSITKCSMMAAEQAVGCM